MIRTLIVDDEPLAREGLRVRLELERDVEIVGEAADGPGAVEAIRRSLPDLVFLDVQMPGLDGFGVVAAVAEHHLPAIVFVTAHDRYAIRAFEVHAMDYLLKPVAAPRLHEAVSRVRRDLERGERGDPGLAPLLAARERGQVDARGDRAHVDRWVVRDGERFLLLRAEEVEWIEAAANYVRFHARGTAFLMRGTMRALARSLDPRRFVRIHRSTIVNLDRVREIRREWHGDYDVVLTGGQRLRLGRRYRDSLLR
ncbi:MAG TPA: response regulator [Gemmatimonadales bacterium]|nr:response regulator [Gemmatimonadales bacterium]